LNVVKFTERQFVERLRVEASRRSRPHRKGSRLRQGIGDDCAVLSVAGRSDFLVTTDLLIEGIHFRREWQEPESLGHKVIARGLSDIAAMGGVPRYAFLSLALNAGTGSRWLDRFFAGLFRIAEASGVTLAGGDTSASKSGLVADVVVIGEVLSGKAILRSGARPGDEIWVSGSLGGAAAGLRLLRQGKKGGRRTEVLQRFLYPQPRLAIGRLLARRGLASAMIDLSDGLSIDLARLCEASGVGARIEAETVPRVASSTLEQALHGGEDYELLFTVPGERADRVPRDVNGVSLSRIGRILHRRRLSIIRNGKEERLPVRGFEHF
jgi:thiamine-monophosphate kinase